MDSPTNHVVIIALLLIILGLLIYCAFFKKCATSVKNVLGETNISRSLVNTSCDEYVSKSGCNKSKLGCAWNNDSGACESSGGDGPGPDPSPGPSPDPSPGPSPDPSPGPAPGGIMNVNGMDGLAKSWILMIKLGSGGNNCTSSGNKYSCKFLYADNENPGLLLVDSFPIDAEDKRNPAYQFYLLCKANSYMTWNDQGGGSCDGAGGWAHDKGGIAYNDKEGIYCQSSCPDWGLFEQGFLASTSNNTGIQTNLAQHVLLVKLNNKQDILSIVALMNQANVCLLSGSISGYSPCVRSGSCSSDYLTKIVGGLTIIAKPKGNRGDDVWGALNNLQCSNGGIDVMSFCSPACPLGNGQSKNSINGVRDINNLADRDSILNTGCGNMKFDSFHSNHSKIGLCGSKVIVGGNNHSTASQGPRGGLFIVIDNKSLASSVKCLYS